MTEEEKKSEKVVILGGGLAPAPALGVPAVIVDNNYDAMLRGEIAAGHGRRRAEEIAKNKAYIDVHPNLKTSDVPGGHNARKMDKEQHEQARLQAMGLDNRKKKPSVAERRKARQQGKEGK